jgi:hypothetical protein
LGALSKTMTDETVWPALEQIAGSMNAEEWETHWLDNACDDGSIATSAISEDDFDVGYF